MHLYVWMDALSSRGRIQIESMDDDKLTSPLFWPEKSAFRPENLAIQLKRYSSTFSAWKFSFRAEKVPFQGPYFLFDSAPADMRNSNLCTNVQCVCYVTADAWNSNMYVFYYLACVSIKQKIQ